MNKYTLTFLDAKTETLYQLSNYSLRYPFIIGFHLACLIFGLIQIITNFESQNTLYISLYSILCIYSLISYPLIHKQMKLQQLDLSIINNIVALLQLTINPLSSPYDIFNFGGTLMMTHTVIFFISDFSFATVQIISIFTIKITISIVQTNSPVTYYLSSVFMMIIMVLCFYKINQVRRVQFMLTLQQNEWTQILPKVVKSPYIMFHYDSYWMKFTLDTSGHLPFDCSNQLELTQFLRKQIVINQSLESFIFRRINKFKEKYQFNEHMILIKDKVKIKIQLISYYLATHCFILIVEQHTVQDQISKKQQALRIKQLDVNHISLICKVFKKIHKGIETKNIEIMSRVRYILFRIYIQKQQMHEDKYNLQPLNLQNSLRFMKKILTRHQIIIFNNDVYTKIMTQRFYLISKIMEIISKFKCRNIVIIMKQDDVQDIIITFTGNQFQGSKGQIIINYELIKSIEEIKEDENQGIKLVIFRSPTQSFRYN